MSIRMRGRLIRWHRHLSGCVHIRGIKRLSILPVYCSEPKGMSCDNDCSHDQAWAEHQAPSALLYVCLVVAGGVGGWEFGWVSVCGLRPERVGKLTRAPIQQRWCLQGWRTVRFRRQMIWTGPAGPILIAQIVQITQGAG